MSSVLIPERYVRQCPFRSDSETLQLDYIARHHSSFNDCNIRQSIINPFDQLPLHIILDIADLLPIRGVLLLSIASLTVSQNLDNSNFWRRRIGRDMPWLWDFPLDDAPNLTNWRKVYFDLQEMCTYDLHSRNLGLVNRKRIWNMCVPIAKGYFQQTLQNTKVAEGGHDVRSN